MIVCHEDLHGSGAVYPMADICCYLLFLAVPCCSLLLLAVTCFHLQWMVETEEKAELKRMEFEIDTMRWKSSTPTTVATDKA